MSTFLHDVSTSLINRYGRDLSELELIFATNRAAIYFRKTVESLGVKPPKTHTIDSFIMSQSEELSVAHNFVLINKLYPIYKAYHPTDSFDSFYSFGKLLLSDFDTIDKYLVDAHALYSIVSDSRELDFSIGLDDSAKKAAVEFWSLFDYHSAKSHTQREFSQIWLSLYAIYKQFNELLDTEKIAYKGKIYRAVAQNTTSILNSSSRYIVVGLNALSSSETTILSVLQDAGKAEFIWDYAPFWSKYDAIEADYFISKNLELFPQASWFSGAILDPQNVEIEVITSPSHGAQSKVMARLIGERIDSGQSTSNTAVVLPDESLIAPVLYSIDPRVTSLNISMGYPLAITSAATFFEQLILLQARVRRGGDGGRFYIHDIEAIISHSYFSKTIDGSVLRSGEALYFSAEQLGELFGGLEVLWQIVGSSLYDMYRYLVESMEFVASYLDTNYENEEDYDNQKCFIGSLLTALQNVKVLIDSSENSMSMNLFLMLLRDEFSAQSIEFEGFSAKGLQIIGILESRTLDFDRVVMTSLCDDIFPSSRPDNSYIPQLLLQGFGMPSATERSAIWSYYFYRLLLRSPHISLIYCNVADGLSTAEPSRYILQLKYSSPYSVVSREVVFEPISTIDNKKIEIEGSSEISHHLSQLNYWPSMVNTYIRCPLSFYLKYVEKLKEPPVFGREISAIESGNIIHYSIEKLYEPLVGVPDVVAKIKDITSQQIAAVVDGVMQKELSYKGDSQPASSAIVRRGIVKMVAGVIRHDASSQTLHSIIAQEKMLKHSIGNHLVSGKIDRIDRLRDGSVRVIDYKSGSVVLKAGSIAELFDYKEQPKKSNSTLVQLLIYALLASKEYRVDVMPSIYPTRRLAMAKRGNNEGFISLGGDRVNYLSVEQLGEFEALLTALLDTIGSEEQAFEQCGEVKNCTYCPYTPICCR